MPSQRSLLFAIIFSLSGCAAVGPNYQAPGLSQPDIPGQWTSVAEVSVKTPPGPDEAKSSYWWHELSDPVLDHLIAEAFASSPTLEAATAKLKQSRSLSVQANSSAGPAVDGVAGTEHVSTDKGLDQSWLSMNASWEIDLFGAVRRGKEGALAREAAQEATLADARVSLAADVADAYLSYRSCQSDTALSELDVASREATAMLTSASVKEGFTAPYQAIRSTASVAEARTQLTAARAHCERLENLLTRLAGIPRTELIKSLAGKPTGLGRLPAPQHFSIAIPKETLGFRPDIRAAERSLAAASADIGLAEADRYPRLSLNGDFGYTVTGTSGKGALSFGSWSFGPSLSLPIFDGGRRKAAVDLARSRYDEALAEFKARTRKAIQEIEDALSRYAAAHERAENARLSASQYQQYFESVEVRFHEGASNLLELEDARRLMLGAQHTFLSVQQERLQAWIALNRATGGGAQYKFDAVPSGNANLVKTTQKN